MKKNILKATLVAAFGLIAGFNVYNSQKSDVMSELALANVEALADDGENPMCENVVWIMVMVVYAITGFRLIEKQIYKKRN